MSLLDKLNGKKTKFGAFLMLVAPFLSGFPLGEVEKIVSLGGQIVASVGLIHSFIKGLRK